MSLVAYAASSDEESDFEEDNKAQVKEPTLKSSPQTLEESSAKLTDDISDDDEDDYEHEELSLQNLEIKANKFGLSLPKPKHEVQNECTTLFANLPTPRSMTKIPVEEELDDEYLHKKAEMKKGEMEKPISKSTKARIQITVPSLKDYSDVDQEKTTKTKINFSKHDKTQGSGLLSLLPKPKSEQNFTKEPDATKTISNAEKTKAFSSVHLALIPDTVRNRRPALNTEGVDGMKKLLKKPISKELKQSKTSFVNYSESDDDDNAVNTEGDFFSLNQEENLPEISTNEINALVAKRAAQIAEAPNKYLNRSIAHENTDGADVSQENRDFKQAPKRTEKHLNEEAMDALLGKNTKRRRKEANKVEVIDISSSQVMPDREEWIRSALSSSTTYQPTGVLNDEEPASGTRRKHQITYLAHKAKSNEAELQAMWAANRQNRRATQSKYGF